LIPRDRIAGILNAFPEVLWDRYVDDPGADETIVYGWAERSDGRHDFLVLAFTWPEAGAITVDGLAVGFTTSSAALSRSFCERLYGTAKHHIDCRRVADGFGALVDNKVPAIRRVL
jgi:hypothetical protein